MFWLFKELQLMGGSNWRAQELIMCSWLGKAMLVYLWFNDLWSALVRLWWNRNVILKLFLTFLKTIISVDGIFLEFFLEFSPLFFLHFNRLCPGDLRSIFIDKSSEPLGIQISCGTSGGIFVSSVGENSLASRAGIQIGDQLLEVCGINMRSATYQLAASVLRQCGDSITMLVQYNPDSKLVSSLFPFLARISVMR